MQIFNKTSKFNFMGGRKLASGLSAAVILVALVSVFARGLNLGIDFTGGTLVEVGYAQPVELPAVRKSLVEGG
ncbi:preprotein translocase subunit SecF, partial [Candidatus Endoriftia persephone str. Guaymas]|nr:preprotein translocase subunit SecF [Candidatus Endoriftia persephone str. Guaymas]